MGTKRASFEDIQMASTTPNSDVDAREADGPSVVGVPVRRMTLSAVTAALKPSLVLENKGNVARDHLASERTYLAYVRTSLACASAGVTLVQLFLLGREGRGLDGLVRPLGATIVVLGLGILVFGLVRYFDTQSALVRGYFPVARYSITAIALMLVSLVGIVFGVIVAGTRH